MNIPLLFFFTLSVGRRLEHMFSPKFRFQFGKVRKQRRTAVRDQLNFFFGSHFWPIIQTWTRRLPRRSSSVVQAPSPFLEPSSSYSVMAPMQREPGQKGVQWSNIAVGAYASNARGSSTLTDEYGRCNYEYGECHWCSMWIQLAHWDLDNEWIS
jgi:hypothetical protein